jgi:CheY-like chemotaxis protein
VEDNPDVREVVVGMLSELGYRVSVASGGAEATEILRGDGRIDLVFSDIVMPHGVTGLDVAREAQRLKPGLPILLTSGYRGDLSFAEGENWPVLAKPFSPADLARTVRDTLDMGRVAAAEPGPSLPPEHASASPEPSAAKNRERLRVLVVEDEALILMAAVDMLSELGHEPISASNAQAAMATLAGDAAVDVMLTDINLPDMNGRDLAAEARRQRPQLPVVFATGHRMGVPEELAGSGPTAVLGKPYWTNELAKALRQVSA